MSLLLFRMALAQHNHHMPAPATGSGLIDAQPLLAQVVRVNAALAYRGSPLPASVTGSINRFLKERPSPAMVDSIQTQLDPFSLFTVTINPEGRVQVDNGAAQPKLVENGWTCFLVKLINQGGVRGVLRAESANALPASRNWSMDHRPQPENVISPGESMNRFLEMNIDSSRPLTAHLSGLGLEYFVLQIYSKTSGNKEATIGFGTGGGSQDIGFRNAVPVLFGIRPAVKVRLHIREADGTGAMASLTIRGFLPGDQAFASGQLYPLPGRRVAAYDEYPDLAFQPQIYREDGEHVMLPPGRYSILSTRGPEYLAQTSILQIPEGKDSTDFTVPLKRWIDLRRFGWLSADHHIHSAGCSHYETPEEGVPPAVMWRQMSGEDLDLGAVLVWGPGWYAQKPYFSRSPDPLSTRRRLMKYDVEVSGFPSSHAGHLVLLGLRQPDYPGTKTIEDWPSCTMPVLQWAKSEGAVTGYAHSGWGLEPETATTELPNFVTPKMDGIGANEFIVTVTKGLVDFYSLGDTPGDWELNMWYHILNCGFRIPISGETDFPCITDLRVGLSRSYFSCDDPVTYDRYLAALKSGRSYVSDGLFHFLHFDANGQTTGNGESQITMDKAKTISVSATVAGYLPEVNSTDPMKKTDQLPFWNLERARSEKSRNVMVELIVNGRVADSTVVRADGDAEKIHFNYKPVGSCWLALRVRNSAHTNPIFVVIGNKPVLEKKSAEWCVRALDQCWKMKEPAIRPAEKAAAKTAYNEARAVYLKMLR